MIYTAKFTLALSLVAAIAWILGLTNSVSAQQSAKVFHKIVKVGELEIFYREAGSKDAPTILLLHGFPTSSQMFRNLIPALADQYHVVAPDYPGYGHSSMPSRDKFSYTFENLAKVIDEFTEKVGLARKVKRDALRQFLTYEATKWQYTHGVKDPELVSPDGAAHDQFLLDRKGNDEIQLDLFLSYGSNPPLYPAWQEYFRTHQPPVLIARGENDQIFPAAAGHFALETNGDEIVKLMREFLGKHVAKK